MYELKSVRVPNELKIDPELAGGLTQSGKVRKEFFLQKGISSNYVNLCFKAYREGVISASRMAEMLIINEKELSEIALLYGEGLRYGD